MKKMCFNKIILLIIPILMSQVFYPRLGQNLLYEILARQPVLVYSFVWMPLMEISMLVTETIAPTTNIKPIENNSKNQPTPFNNEESSALSATTSNIFIALNKLFILPLVKLNAIFNAINNNKHDIAFLVLSPLFAIYFFRVQCIRLAAPSLPRGDNPLLF